MAAGQIREQPLRARLEVHAREAGKSFLPGEERGEAIDADTEISSALIPEEPQDLLVHLHEVQQEILIAHFREADFLLRRRQARHVVGVRAGVEPQHVLLRLRRERRVRKIFRAVGSAAASAAARAAAVAGRRPSRRRPFPAAAAVADDELVDAPRFLVEEGRLAGEPERSIERSIRLVGLEKAIDVDADVVNHRSRVLVVAIPGLDIERAAVQREHAAAVGELVALRVAAEVVVVVEDEHLRAAADVADEVVRRRQPAQPPADHDEVVRLAGVDRAGEIPAAAIAQLVRDLERSLVAAAHADARRRIVVGRALGREFLLRGARELGRERRSDDAQRHAVQEVAARDGAAHAEVAIVVHAITTGTSARRARCAAA